MAVTDGVIGLVPVRGLGTGKTRLAADLTPEARQALTGRMLRGVVQAALDADVLAAVAVVSPDPAALALARSLDDRVVPLLEDPTLPGLNAAIAAGRDWAVDRDAAALLVLFGDLPLLTAEEVRRLVAHEAPVVIAADRHGTGTNALLLRLDGAGARFSFRFGQGSAERHAAEARRVGLAVAWSEAPGTAFDLDTPEDWRTLLGVGGWATSDSASEPATAPTRVAWSAPEASPDEHCR